MAARVFTSLQDLQDAVRDAKADHQVFSFDVFDTLLVRRIHNPDLVKDPVSRFLARRAGELGREVRTKRVRTERDRIEQGMREENLREHGDGEAIFPVWIEAWVRSFVPEAYVEQVAKEVEEVELSLEQRVLVVRQGWRELLEELQDAEKTVIAMSDMYLPSPYIKRLLDHAGLEGFFDHVVSSADQVKSKASGAGYRYLMEENGFACETWLHAGDNPFSDALVPDSLGITAFSLRDVRERKRYAVLHRLHHSCGSKGFWVGRYALQAAIPLEEEIQSELQADPLYVEGACLFGPLVAGFMAHLAERSREGKLPILYFLSREGWMFREIWQRMAPLLELEGPLPEIRYLHVSRKALASASCGAKGLTLELIELLLLPIENRDLRDVFRVADLDSEPLLPYLKRYGLEDHPPISVHHEGYDYDTWLMLEDLLVDEEFQAEVRQQKARDIEGLRSYLYDIQFFEDEHVGFVDVGWLGSIQKFFDLCISDEPKRPVIHGHYLAASRRRPFNSHTHSHLEGWLYDNRKGDAYAGCCMLYQELFEEVCRPGLPGLLRYEPDLKGFCQFRSRDDLSFQKESEQTKSIARLHEGMFDIAERYATVLTVATLSPNKLRAWIAQTLAVKLAFPKTKEVALLRHHHHMNDLGRESAEQSGTLKRDPDTRLWDRSLTELRWRPFLRWWNFLKHQLFEMVITHER